MINRICIFLLTTSCLLSWLTGCESPRSDLGLKFEDIVIDRNIPLIKGMNADDERVPSTRISIQLLECKSGCQQTDSTVNATLANLLFGIGNPNLRSAAETFCNRRVQEYRNDYHDFYLADSATGEIPAWYDHQYELKTELVPSKDDICAYKATVWTYEGGAHGYECLLAFNFNANTGEQISVNKLFAKGYENSLKDLLLARLMENAGEHTMEGLNEKGYLSGMEMYVTDNFIMGKDSITFIYNQYEIAPYALGRIELSLHYKEVKSLLASPER